jgi:hypothetical protein
MKKLFSGLVAMAFVLASGASFAAAHVGKDDKAMEEKKAACAKADPKMDEKMKAECKAMMDKKS